MPAWLAKIFISFAPEPKKLLKVILGIIVFPFFILLVVFAIPLGIAKTVPLATPGQIQTYVDAADNVSQGKGIQVDWRNVIACDAVLLKQDFSKTSIRRAEAMSMRFVKATAIQCDDKVIIVYSLKSLNEVIVELIAEGVIKNEQAEDIYLYLSMDLSLLRDVGCEMPPGWAAIDGEYKWPIPGCYTITSKFGPRIDPIEYLDGFHSGLDIGGPYRTPIIAAKDGVVKKAGKLGNAGNAVIIKHNDGTETRYYHLDSIIVKKKDKVTAGQIVGYEGSTGKSTGPHLHFEIRINGEAVDPLLYFY